MGLENNPDIGELDSVLEDLNTSVFSEALWLDSNMYKVTEVTYNYSALWEIEEDGVDVLDRWPFVNTTLFCDIGWLDITDFANKDVGWRNRLIYHAKEKIESIIQERIKNINEFKERINSISSSWEQSMDAKKKIILWGLDEIVMQLQACILGLDFEVEKALIGHYFLQPTSQHIIPPEDRKNKEAEIDDINTKIYWDKLSDSKDYRKGVIDYYYTKYSKYQEAKDKDGFHSNRLLSEEETQRYEGYLKKLWALEADHVPQKNVKPKKYIDEDYENIQVNRSDVIAWFNHHLIASDLSQRAEPDDKVSGVTDTPSLLKYPWKWEKFDNLDVTRIAKLNAHEIWQHAFSIERHMKVIWNIRWAKNLELAEWVASLFEDLYEYGPNIVQDSWINGKKYQIIDISKLEYVASFPKTLMQEILTDEEFYDFLKLNNKVEPDKMTPLRRYLRHMRTWIQRKDITYTTWKIKAAQYLNQVIMWQIEWDFSDLWAWKVWFDQIQLFRDAEESRSVDKEKLLENMMFYEAQYFAIEQRKKRRKYRESIEFTSLNKQSDEYKDGLKKFSVTEENFFTYLGNKYPFLDFSDEKIKSVRHIFKKQLLWAVKLEENSIEASKEIEEHWIDSEMWNLYRYLRWEQSGSTELSEKIIARWEKDFQKAV